MKTLSKLHFLLPQKWAADFRNLLRHVLEHHSSTNLASPLYNKAVKSTKIGDRYSPN